MAGRDVTIELGGETRHLRIDLNALALFGERLGITIRLSNLTEDLFRQPLPLSAPRVLLWAALQAKHPELTEQEVGAMVTGENFGVVSQGFFELLKSMLPAELAAKLDDYVERSKDKGKTAVAASAP